jgi:hypothetical protein
MPKSRGRKKPKKPQLTKMMRDALVEQRAAFRAKFGRDPGPNDPLLFDPDKDEPTPIREARLDAEMLEAMRKTSVAPQIIYAIGRRDGCSWKVDAISIDLRPRQCCHR